ncbi:MAG: DNA polymerase IV [Chloroflexi bacterium]|nr:DNA polymerase IV [Chloroflexota bacterium]
MEPGTSQARQIMHLDLDAFFASMEELLDPTLRGLPLAVGGSPTERGVVSSASYAARRFGVRSAMPTAQALRLCPDLILRPPRHGLYGRYSQQVMAILRSYSPLMEQISIDEAFVDLTGCETRWGPALAVAQEAQGRIQNEVGLSASVGLASSKLVAKIASGLRKPAGLVVVEPGSEAAFLAPLAVDKLWGVGPATEARLRTLGIRTVGHLAACPLPALTQAVGPQAEELQERARGIDRSEVTPEHDAKSISRETTFRRDVADAEALRKTLLRLSERVARHLRRDGAEAHTVTLKLRYSDFTTLTRSQSLPRTTALGLEIYQVAWALLLGVWDRRRPVRLIGVGATNLQVGQRQLTFLRDAAERRRELADTLDRLRDRYGDDVVRPASLLEPSEDDAPPRRPR